MTYLIQHMHTDQNDMSAMCIPFTPSPLVTIIVHIVTALYFVFSYTNQPVTFIVDVTTTTKRLLFLENRYMDCCPTSPIILHVIYCYWKHCIGEVTTFTLTSILVYDVLYKYGPELFISIPFQSEMSIVHLLKHRF